MCAGINREPTQSEYPGEELWGDGVGEGKSRRVCTPFTPAWHTGVCRGMHLPIFWS